MDVILQQFFTLQRGDKSPYSWSVTVTSPSENRGAFVDTALQLGRNGKIKKQRKAFVRGVNLGKPDERTPLRIALLHASSLIKKKLEQGYVETTK